MNNIARTSRQASSSPFDLLVNDFFEGEFNPRIRQRVVGKPSANVYESKEDYRVELLVPGFEKSDLNISIDGQIISIKGEKAEAKVEVKQLRKEFEVSSFLRSFKLTDDVDAETVEANYKNGVLELIMKKSLPQKAEAKKIEIK